MSWLNPTGVTKVRYLGRAVVFCALVFMLSFHVAAQTRQQTPQSPPQSELARQNQDRVAASVGQIVTILHRDPGLMVELKHWIAKDATDHGQLISDSDLTDEAIFDRLESDVTFRSVATLLVQKYGFLKPSINPDSPMAQEQQILIQERAKYIAQDEEFARSNARQQQTLQQTLQQTPGCDSTISNCSVPRGNKRSIQALPEQTPGMNESPGNLPDLQNQPAVPPGSTRPGAPETGVASLMRTSGDDSLSLDSMQSAGGTGEGGSDFGSSTGTLQPAQGSDLSLNSDFPEDSVSGMAGGPTSSQVPSANTRNRASSANVSSIIDIGNRSSDANSRRSRELVGPTQKLTMRQDPYAGIPSLYDMYLQAAPRPPELERFGMQIFENGTRDLQMIPMDMPVGPDYVLGTGDGISIDLWGGVSRRFYRVVDREGRISLPEVGPVLVAGKSLGTVQESVQKNLRTQFRDVSADVSLSRLRTVRIYVVGDVVKPGAYDVSSLSTPLNALFAAGGPTARGSLRILKHYRGDALVQDVDVYDLLLHGVKGKMERLESGDTVMVPPLGPEITMVGMVRRPGIYEQKDEKTLADLIELSGGLLPTATLRHIEVQRTIAHEKKTMLNLDVPPDASSSDALKQISAFQLQDADTIRIFPIAPYTQDAVYLEGHVIRPGKYAFHAGMKVTDLVATYKDLLPEPALQYGEIIRLSLPDYRPTVQSFNVAEALADPSKAPQLQPLDTIEFFGRYDFENPPDVSVWGDVRTPGTYPTAGDIHLSDAVHLAGGLSADAATGDAQVFRYQPDSTLKILNVKLSSALDGSPVDDIMLHPRDRVLIHRNPAAIEPVTVYIKGEVARPGRYPLTAQMRTSDLIRAAGGLKTSADPKTADLTHYSWQDDKQVTGEHQRISLADAMGGNGDANPALSNGDVLTVAQVAGWNDLGASISIRGEVAHPGSYGIRPGERLSSVLERAGGFSPAAYPYGSVLLRLEVQKLEQRSYGELIQRVREQQTAVRLTAAASADPDQKMSAESALVQWQSTLDTLLSTPPTGRVTVQISANLKDWVDTARDVTVRSGDVLVIPKRPSYVMVQGQVYGPTAVAYRPGKSASWYLTQAGGQTNMANKKATFVIRANGTVVGSHNSFWVSGDGLNVPLQPGDMVVVPEKALGGPPVWKAVFTNAQVLSSIATSAILAASVF
jgi:protein involved in polysaccharide export with SLBB domain